MRMLIEPCTQELEKLTNLEKTRIGKLWLFFKIHNRLPSPKECSMQYGHARQIWDRFYRIMIHKCWIHQSFDHASKGFTPKAVERITKANNKCHER